MPAELISLLAVALMVVVTVYMVKHKKEAEKNLNEYFTRVFTVRACRGLVCCIRM